MDVNGELVDQSLKIKNLEKEIENMKVAVKHDLIQLLSMFSEQKVEIRNLKLALENYKPEPIEHDGRVGIYG
jgi:hypothetical protein